jgi:hypothetical protein
MQSSSTPSRLISLLSLTAGLALFAGIDTVRAQVANGDIPTVPQVGNPSSRTGPIGVGPGPQVKPPQAEPPALPGAASHGDRVAPSTGTIITDPNAALFDAINRGDIASAHDALDRGADLEAHNVLDMTPLDLSVDLGRNDITFLLLSLRNGDSPPGNRAPTGSAQAAPGSKLVPTGTTPAAARTRAAARTPPASPAKPVAPATPRLFAGDGGTPNPTAGFLGFDNRH